MGEESVQTLNYEAATLFKNTFIDEYGIHNIEFINAIGQLVLKRKTNGDGLSTDTYYSYNEYGDVIQIVQPEALNNLSNISDYVFTYTYDNKQRLEEKIVPGKAPESFVYDDYDRVIEYNNGLETIYTDYDILGRITQTYDDSDILTSYYYDNISDIKLNHIKNEFGVNYYMSTIGPNVETQPCSVNYIQKDAKIVELVNVLKPKEHSNDDGVRDYILNTYNYDNLGRVTAKCSSSFLEDGEEMYNYDYSPQWDLTEQKSYIKYPDLPHKENVKMYEYDNAGRVTNIQQTKEECGIPSGFEQIVSNTYDDLGRLQTKNIGGIQNIDYGYTMRGWLLEINQIDEHDCGSIYEYLPPPTSTDDPILCSPVYNEGLGVKEDCWENTKMSLYEFYILSEPSFNTKEEEEHLSNLIDYISQEEDDSKEEELLELQNSSQEIKLLELQNLLEENGYIVDKQVLLENAYAYGDVLPLMQELSSNEIPQNNESLFTLDRNEKIRDLNKEVVSYELQDNYMESYTRMEKYLSKICEKKEIDEINAINDRALGESILENGGVKIKNINPNQSVFAIKLDYTNYTPNNDANPTAATYKTNLIDIQGWRSAIDCTDRKYDYSYDWLNRITDAIYSQTPPSGTNGETYPDTYDSWNYPTTNVSFNVSGIMYDDNGNVTNIQRNGLLNNKYELGTDDLSFGAIDDLNLRYEGNRLVEVDDALTYDNALSPERIDFNDSSLNETNSEATEYVYDAKGNMTEDSNRGIRVTYNYLNLPESIYRNPEVMHIYYDALGNKLRKQKCRSRFKGRSASDSDENDLTEGKEDFDIDGVDRDLIPITGPLILIPSYNCGFVKDYIDTREYSRNGDLTPKLLSIYNEEGRLSYRDNDHSSFEYVIKDHLGSPRIYLQKVEYKIEDPNDPSQTITETEVYLKKESHYYPFGMTMSGISPTFETPGEFANFDTNTEEYNGKEHHDDFNLGWTDYGARWYDPQVGRWWSADPLADKNHADSPFNYVMNNPTMYTDKDGCDTLIMHRILLEGDYGTISNVFEVNFTIMSDGYETLVLDNDGNPITYFMISTIEADVRPGNEIERDHPLRFQVRASKLDEITGEIIDPRAKNDILLYESASGEQFIHWGTSGINFFDGCMGLGEILANDSPAYFDPIVSQKAMQEVRDLHEYYKANLTGKEFILRPYSKPITVGQRRKEILEKLLKE